MTRRGSLQQRQSRLPQGSGFGRLDRMPLPMKAQIECIVDRQLQPYAGFTTQKRYFEAAVISRELPQLSLSSSKNNARATEQMPVCSPLLTVRMAPSAENAGCSQLTNPNTKGEKP
jgi:hypothetical protein